MRTPPTFPSLSLCFLAFLTGFAHGAPSTTVKVGVILDLGTLQGKMSLTSINLAFSDFYARRPPPNSTLSLLVRDSSADVVAAASAAVDLLLNEQVHAIIGPQTSSESTFVANLGSHAGVPIISFTAASPALNPSRLPFFVRTAAGDYNSQSGPIAAVVSLFGWRRTVLIHEDSPPGLDLMPALTAALDAVGAPVAHLSPIPSAASSDRIARELYMLKTMQTRVFIVHASLSLATRLFTIARSAGMMEDGYAWIVSVQITALLGNADPTVVADSMQGVIGIRPFIPRSKRIHSFEKRWKRSFFENYPEMETAEPSVFDYWAYDTVWAVAMAAEETDPADLWFDRPRRANLSEIEAVGVSLAGPKLLRSMSTVDFAGLGGRFKLFNGGLGIEAFEIVNVVGEKERGIGMWTADKGIFSQRSGSEVKGLGAVVWPGESTVVPKGWEIPTEGNKLRIAVPAGADPGFWSFMRVEKDPVTNRSKASGFVIDVFEAAVAELPYALPFEYVGYVKEKDGTAGPYNNVVGQVYLKKYDAVVGDTTITAKRSALVDFTQPYTVAGVSMVVPVVDERDKNTWIFLKPLTADLWLVSGAFFVFTGAVVWVLEHRINEEFRGPPANQLGTVFYFSFSTLVFAHKEGVVSNLSRFVVIVWVFVVLILTSSYTASLTSMLTVQQLQPAITEMSQLIKSGEYVGYLKDSFVKELLLGLGFDKSKLRPYHSPQEYARALSQGSSNGGVAAIVDEIPYLKVFLKDYCNNYTMVGSTYKTGGFGFAFPKGSPLPADLSRAILNITEGEKIAGIERKWFGDQSSCLNQGSITVSSNSLTFNSFWGLFLITGAASCLSLLLSLASFLYEHWHDLNQREIEGSFWTRFSRSFDKKDLSFYTFRRESKGGSMAESNREPTNSPYRHELESHSSSNHTYEEGSRFPATPLSSIVQGR